jgi:transposase
VNANLIFKWLKDPRFAPDTVEGEAETIFLPGDVGASYIEEASGLPEPYRDVPDRKFSGRITIELSGGLRLCAVGGFDPDLLARLLKGIIS